MDCKNAKTIGYFALFSEIYYLCYCYGKIIIYYSTNVGVFFNYYTLVFRKTKRNL